MIHFYLISWSVNSKTLLLFFKSLNVTSIPSGSQDTVWDPSTCLKGSMSSCFALYDTITDIQARLLYELGPNQFSFNWLDIQEMSDLKAKFLFHYDAKCAKDLTCYDLSPNKLCGKYSGTNLSCDNFKVSRLFRVSKGSAKFHFNSFLFIWKTACFNTSF